MASTISNVNQALVDERVVGALRYVLPMLNAFSIGISDGPVTLNDKVYVPIATDPTKGTKTPGTMAAGSGTLAGTLVTVDTPEQATWDATEGNMPARLFPEYWANKASGAVYVLAKSVIDAGLALLTATNFGNAEGVDKLTVAPADFGANDLGKLWQYAATKIKQRVKSLGLNAPFAGALMGEANLAQIFSNTGQNFLSSGVLPQLIGMNTWAYPEFPANSENLGGAVFGQAAILAAIGYPEPLFAAGDGNISGRRVITDPESGISVLYTEKADAGGTITGECQLYYGVEKGQDAAVLLKSA
jgi:hypothetical protein